MKGHGGDKWRQSACEALASARKLHATTQDHRNVAFLAGQAVELVLVAIGIKQRNLLDVPNNERGAVWHGLPHLMKVHGVQVVLDQAVAGNRLLRDNWLVVKYWDSNARFPTTSIKGKDAVEMLNAVAHADHGIFQWLLNRYDQI